jgi:hypothetical protein
VNFIIYLEPPYLLDYNYIVIPLPTVFLVSAYLNGEGVQEFLTQLSARATFKWLFVPRLPKRSPETAMVGTPTTLQGYNFVFRPPIETRSKAKL